MALVVEDVALGGRALGDRASERAVGSIPQTRSERNPPLRAARMGGQLIGRRNPPRAADQSLGRSMRNSCGMLHFAANP
jgi:hypothetical protein